MKHFRCPEGDWSVDTDDELEGYMRLYFHETLEHPESGRRLNDL